MDNVRFTMEASMDFNALQSTRRVFFPGPVHEQVEEENPAPWDQPQDETSLSRPVVHIDENEEIVITSAQLIYLHSRKFANDKVDIRAADAALGLRRLPAWFYLVVHYSSLEWRTENKRSSVSEDVVEWSGPIPIPSDLSATVCLEVYASFEFQPTLGTGEQLRKLTITVEQLLDRSVNIIPFKLFTKDGDVVSPCSSIFVTVKRSKRERSDPLAHSLPGPRCSITKSRGELEDATNQGHGALSYYRKHGGKHHLECSIAAFERALEICLLNHPCRAAAEANLAMAKFIICQAGEPDVSQARPTSISGHE
ncbi:hypothetical protein JVT61DRAFT_13534 [Boletus reticuloceps]|uniref:Uncharacterized protein n=1 Tax=Boletus reticuloceps TaxID=495285 RepID=A0A8I2YDE4_9AGAM|nr:hypothetical protein JVT61DRAFT_13534 [Boletus reticuloceps]